MNKLPPPPKNLGICAIYIISGPWRSRGSNCSISSMLASSYATELMGGGGGQFIMSHMMGRANRPTRWRALQVLSIVLRQSVFYIHVSCMILSK